MSPKAIYIEDDGKLVVKALQTLYKPTGDEILVTVTYSGINPADARHPLELGIRSTVAGYDFAGTVRAIGPNCTKFKPGDIVAGTTPSEGIGRPQHFGAHQDELICPQDSAYSVADGLPLEAAAVIPVVVRTAADGVIFLLGFNFLGKKSAENHSTSGGSLLIWGAGSSCGFSALQVAKLCGANPIVVTASPQHHAQLKKLGATHCFDYRSPTVVQDIQSLGKELCGLQGIRNGFDCIGLSGTERREHMAPTTAACCGQGAKIATVIPHPSFLDAWAQPERAATFKPNFLGGETALETPVDAKRAAQSMEVLQWVAKNYGEGNFIVPRIKIVKGGAENALEAILEVGKLGAGMCKVAILHPL